MPNSNPRNRMVVFRLTQEEYTRLREACRSKGGRNLSEFTRSELLALLCSDAIPAVLQKRFQDLEGKLVDIEGAVAEIAKLLGNGRKE